MDLHEIIVRDDDASASALATKPSCFEAGGEDRGARLSSGVDDEDDSRDAVTFEPTSEDVEGYSAKNVRRFILDQVPDLTISVTAERLIVLYSESRGGAESVALRRRRRPRRDVLRHATHREFVFGVTSDDNEALMSQFQVTSVRRS